MRNRYREARLRAKRLLVNFKFDEKVAELRAIEDKMADRATCMTVSPATAQRHGELMAELAPFVYIKTQIEALDCVEQQIEDFSEDVVDFDRITRNMEFKATMTGKFARNSAIVTIHARDGGTEACDWTDMLSCMYIRWATDCGYAVSIQSQDMSKGAGISSMTIKITGSYVYGFLSGENGLHRLVRISPFNAQNKRQTSFAAVQVDPVLPKQVQSRITQSDLEWDFFRAPGPGGQKKNVTDSGVRLFHKPSGITVTCVTDRSQHANKETAIVMLVARLARRQEEKEAAEKAAQHGTKPTVGFGSQIRSYFKHPTQRVTDARTGHQSGSFQKVLGGGLQPFIDAYLIWKASQ